MGKSGSKQSASPASLCGKHAGTLYGTQIYDKLDTVNLI